VGGGRRERERERKKMGELIGDRNNGGYIWGALAD